MEIKVKKSPSETVFELEGSLDIYSSVDFKESLGKNADEKNINIILDLKKLKYLDSSGIGALISALNYSKERDSTIRISSVNPAVEKIMQVSGIAYLFESAKPNSET